MFDTELVSKVHWGKAPDNVGLTAEHFQYSHPSVLIALTKLFLLIGFSGCVPDGFEHIYIVPIPKIRDMHSKVLTCDNFTGIAISPIISKFLEYCVIDLCNVYF